MTQQEVINLLKKNKEWMTPKEINEILNYNSSAANLLKLYKQNLLIKKEFKNERGHRIVIYKLK